MNKLIEILKWSKEYLEKKDVTSARLNAEYIIAHVLKYDRLSLYLNYEKPLLIKEKKEIKDLLKKRAEDKIPLQYLIGEEEFYGYKFEVNTNVLIPRPETERLVEESIKLIVNILEPMVLDIGTGSGAIAISIAKEIPASKVLGVDISDKALEVANRNKELNEVNNLKFLKSDIFSNIKFNNFDLIISNPPYIAEEEYITLMPEVKDHEPKLALLAKDSGNYFYKEISKNAMKFLNDNGILAFEIGYNQGEIVKNLMEKNNFKNVKIIKDYNNIDRVVLGEKI